MSLADTELKDFESDLVVSFQGLTLPVFVIMEKLLRITDKEGHCVPFILNRQQIELYKEICYQRRAGKPVRQNVLKSRQIGYSTFIAGLFFVIGMFTPNMKVGVVADVEKHAKDIFSKYEYFYNHLDDGNPHKAEIEEYARANKGQRHPASYKPKLKAQRGQTMLQTEAGNSIIEVVVAGEGSGRSNTYHLLHLSECAFFKNLKVTLNGLLETVSSKNKNSFIFLETTANGFNEYKDRWDKDCLGQTSYNALFMPWFKNPEYCEDEFNKEGIKMPPMENWLYEKQKEYGLTNGQMVWYWNKYQDKGDRGLVLQEYPFCPTDSFLTSGNCIFNTELIAKRKEELLPTLSKVRRGLFATTHKYSEDGSVIHFESHGFVEGRNGAIAIYVEPIEGHPYIANCDPAMGGADYYAIQVIDNYTGEQVAVYHCNTPNGDDEVAFQLVALGRYYNNALISAECNNANGYYILQIADKCGYKFIYQDTEYDSINDRWENRFGYKTKQSNKIPMTTMLKLQFRDNYRCINDFETLCEMEEFEVVKNQTTQRETVRASGSSHDDLVMSLCGCFYIRNAQVQSCVPIYKKEAKISQFVEDPFHRKREQTRIKKGAFIQW